MIITIDGPAGTGKTTVAKRVAECLHFFYFDTGAMYRSVAWKIVREKIALSDLPRIEELLENLHFRIESKGKEKHYFVGDEEVTEEIRSQEITKMVSAVSALPVVRKSLLMIQRDFAKGRNVVFEGRDMGSVVFPEAEVRIFLTARPEVRAQRRLDELLQKRPEDAEGLDLEKMREELMRRDELDSTRAIAPLKCPEGAYVVDTSDLSIDEVIGEILKYKMRLDV